MPLCPVRVADQLGVRARRDVQQPKRPREPPCCDPLPIATERPAASGCADSARCCLSCIDVFRRSHVALEPLTAAAPRSQCTGATAGRLCAGTFMLRVPDYGSSCWTTHGPSVSLQFRRIAVSGILGTDMARHPLVVDTLQSLSSGAGLSEPQCRSGARVASRSPDVLAPSPEELSALVLHAADLSAPLCPDFSIAYEWSERCYAEFNSQVRFSATEVGSEGRAAVSCPPPPPPPTSPAGRC